VVGKSKGRKMTSLDLLKKVCQKGRTKDANDPSYSERKEKIEGGTKKE